jgi:hypothetical protein
MTTCARALQYILVAVLAASTVACGNATSATGPSGAPSGGAVISGRVNMTGSAAATIAARFPLAVGVWAGVVPLASTTSSTVTVTIVGTDVSTTVDGGGTFTLNGVPPGTVQLRFQGRGADATVTISGVEADDRLNIVVTLNGSSARLDTNEKTSGGKGNGNGNGVDVNGRIDSINNAARTVSVNGTTVLVTSSTVIRHGNQTFAFSDLRVGDHIQVKGARNGSMVTASEIKVEQGGNGDDGDDDDNEDVDRTQLRGTVSLLIGLCPGLTMTVSGTQVVTNAATQFVDITCNTLRNDMRVVVDGIRRNDGSVLATKIDREDDVQTEVRGTVSLLVGLCPGLTFTVAGSTVVTNGATRFAPIACSALRNNMRVTVQGIRRNDGSVLATSVAAEDDTQAETRGTVSLLIGTCPGLTFTVAGTPVVTNAATLFAPTACSALRNNMRVTVQGIRRTDGSVLATSVSAEA